MNRGFIHSIFLIGTLLLFSALSAHAADRHYFRSSLDFSYARDFSHADEVQPVVGSGQAEPLEGSNGFAPALGIGWRMVHGHFLLDAGLGAEFRQCYDRLAVAELYATGVDEEGFEYMGHHMWTNRTALVRHAGIHVPVMAGGEWGRFCFLLGVKAAVDLWGTSTEQGGYSLEGDYDRYVDSFSNMAAHGFVTDEFYACPPVEQALAWGVRACAEIGYCVAWADGAQMRGRGKSRPKWYVSLFGEYAVLGSRETYSPLLVGARVTMLLPLPETVVCKCLKF